MDCLHCRFDNRDLFSAKALAIGKSEGPERPQGAAIELPLKIGTISLSFPFCGATGFSNGAKTAGTGNDFIPEPPKPSRRRVF